MLYDAANGGRHFEATRYVQMPVSQTVESRAKIQVQQLGDRHTKIRVTMSIDRQALQTGDRLTHRAFDGGTRLPGCQEQRLVVDDTPLIKNVGVRSDGVPPTLGVHA